MGKKADSLADLDRDSLRRYLDGNQQAFFEFFERHKNSLYNFSYDLVRNRECAEDITQEAFMRFIARIDAYDFRYAASTLLYTIARNLCLDSLKSAYRQKTLLSDDPEKHATPESGQTGLELFTRRELAEYVESCIEKLGPKEKSVLLLSRNTGMKPREIGRTLQVTERTAQRLLKSALERIRDQLLAAGYNREDFT